MNMHAVFIRGILIVAFSMALSVAIVHRAYSPQPLQVTVAPPVVVHRTVMGQPAAVVLPTVHVRPSPADIASARASTNNTDVVLYMQSSAGAPLEARASLPGLHLDMPYYSFGKTLPRVSKE